MLTAHSHTQPLTARLSPEPGQLVPGHTVWLQVMSEHTCFYKNEEIVR